MPPTGGYRVPRLSVQDIANNLYKAVFDSWDNSVPDYAGIYSAIKWGVHAAFTNPEDVSNPIEREQILDAIQSGTKAAWLEYLRDQQPVAIVQPLRDEPIAVFDDDPVSDDEPWDITIGKFTEE